MASSLPSTKSDVARIRGSVWAGDARAAERLLALVHEELRPLAAVQMAGERPGQTIQGTALVHDAWLRLRGEPHAWENRRHFFRAAAEAMCRILSSIIRTSRRDSKLRCAHDLASMVQVSLLGSMTAGAFLGLADFDCAYHLIAITVVIAHPIAQPQPAGPFGEIAGQNVLPQGRAPLKIQRPSPRSPTLAFRR